MGFHIASSSSELFAGSFETGLVFTGYSISVSFILAAVAEMIDAAESTSSVFGITDAISTFDGAVFKALGLSEGISTLAIADSNLLGFYKSAKVTVFGAFCAFTCYFTGSMRPLAVR